MSIAWAASVQTVASAFAAAGSCPYIWQDGGGCGELQRTYQRLPKRGMGRSSRRFCVWPGPAAQPLCDPGGGVV